MGERFNGIEEVVGSNPISSTNKFQIYDFGFSIYDVASPEAKIINRKNEMA